ncbi:inositol monophosphatase family protein [Serpentinicella sp. ANB-PHB4]|uniref:inositol monophosphatase family protein n=1 Tax=Serpentinicella sp. ANB-PHB4 TaxID=3074076 RepID=UPI00285FBAD8|nr:inositol monophosphatase family protein [Serpentinicella sp. ANB-PHB4]MDR5658431.1 inositol monophosphatase family protein [Serpentinicella sp. ANB-PHB4]
MKDEWKQRLENLNQWVMEAGKEQLLRMNESIDISQKDDDIDLVTEMDIWTDEFLHDKIKNFFPNDTIFSEEKGGQRGTSEYKWIIDPIDGTTNYAHRFPMFCISVAIKHKEETVVGVIYAPMIKEHYQAVKGEGTFLNGKKVQVSSVTKMTSSLIATGFPYDRKTDSLNNLQQFNAVVLNVGGMRRTGSAALDLCQVAAGRFEAYWEYKINPWDFEAGLLLIQEAGGKVYKRQLEKGYLVIAGNPYIFSELRQLIKE